jgi:tetratricopeptide (TPR) repeat protein
MSRLHWRWPALAGLLLMLATANTARSSYSYRFGTGVHEGMLPMNAANFIHENKIAGRMFNSYAAGGYLIWRLWPEHKVFIDGREDVYIDSGVLHDYVHCFDSQFNWQNLVSKYGIDYAIVRYPEQAPARPESSLDVLAFPRNEWGLVYFDDVVAVYIRRNGKNDSILREKEIRMVQPFQLSGYLDGIAKDSGKLRAFSAEMDANLRDHPSSYRAHHTLGVLAVKRGPQYLEQAILEFEQAVSLNQEFAPGYVNLGSIYMYRGRYDEAKHLLQKALSLEKNPLAEDQLKRLHSMGR